MKLDYRKTVGGRWRKDFHADYGVRETKKIYVQKVTDATFVTANLTMRLPIPVFPFTLSPLVLFSTLYQIHERHVLQNSSGYHYLLLADKSYRVG